MSKKKFPGFGRYVVDCRQYYRKGRTYRRGDKVTIPLDEKPPKTLVNEDGTKIEWDDEKRLVVNTKARPGRPQDTTADEIMNAAEKLAGKHSAAQLQEMCYGLNLDPNGTKKDMAGRILTAQAGTLVDDSDDAVTEDTSEVGNVQEVGGATGTAV